MVLMNYDITVVIPCYNCEKTITYTCESILNQTVLPKKIILINDGSTDNTINIINKIATRNKDIIEIIDKKNEGVSSSRNVGINLAETSWIAFCDADDYWMKNKIETVYNAITQNKNVEFISHAYFINKEGNSLVKKNIEKNAFLDTYKENFIQTSTVVAKKELLEKVGLFDTTLAVAEDFDLWLKCTAICSFIYIPVGLSIYTISDKEVSLSSNEMRMYMCTLIVLNRHYENLCKFMGKKDAKKFMYKRIIKLIFAEMYYQLKRFELKNTIKSFLYGLKILK